MSTANLPVIRVFSWKSRTEKHKTFLIHIIRRYRCITFSDSHECSPNSLLGMQGCMSKSPNIRANVTMHCQYLQLKTFIKYASSSPSLKSCGEIIIINMQRILSIASLLSATNFCLSESGLCPSPSAAILSY